MLKNRRGATSLRWLQALLDHGIEVHGQVVVCPGVNDGRVLTDTLVGVLDQYPSLASLAVVPLGVSRHSHEEAMRPHTFDEAVAVVDLVEEWQSVFLDVLGRRLVFAADEYYLLAGRPFPPAAAYDGFGVTGLITGEDVARVLADQPEGERYLLPDVCLTNGVFLDGVSPADLPRPVEIVPADGASLRRALLRVCSIEGHRDPPIDQTQLEGRS